LLHKRHPRWSLPGRSTACDILKRHGMVPLRRQRRRVGHPGKPTSLILAPNDVWSADYKGQFRTGDGRYCYPLTVADGFSRYLLGCQALTSTAVDEARPIFARLFQEYGLPKRIRTDNGVPFATTTLARLSKLSAWWVRLGILPELIEPGRPAQNGRHERMHRTLKAETTRPAAGSLAAQQRRFNVFREEFNHERLYVGGETPEPAATVFRSCGRGGSAENGGSVNRAFVPSMPTAAATEKRVAPASARPPQLDLQRKLLGRLTHPRLSRIAWRHRLPPSVSTGRTAWTWSSGAGPKYRLCQLWVVSTPISQTSPGATTVRPHGAWGSGRPRESLTAGALSGSRVPFTATPSSSRFTRSPGTAPMRFRTA
jgi:transposase InsO family protein